MEDRMSAAVVKAVALFVSLCFVQFAVASHRVSSENARRRPRPAVPTLKPQDAVFLSVKTSLKFHASRVKLQLETWAASELDNTWWITDRADTRTHRILGSHLIETHCPSSHGREGLVCKLAVEVDSFLDTSRSWFCHFDDDQYVNVPALRRMLSEHDASEEWYIGRPSLTRPVRVPKVQKESFWFATGGAGYCVSRAAMERARPLMSGGRLVTVSRETHLPDDMTFAYIVNGLLQIPLTIDRRLHSHLEDLNTIDVASLVEQLSWSYSLTSSPPNLLHLAESAPGHDVTRLLAAHCVVSPQAELCQGRTVELGPSSGYSIDTVTVV